MQLEILEAAAPPFSNQHPVYHPANVRNWRDFATHLGIGERRLSASKPTHLRPSDQFHPSATGGGVPNQQTIAAGRACADISKDHRGWWSRAGT